MGKLKIRWLGQSGYLLSDGRTTVCIDPYLSDAVERVAGRRRMVPAPVLPEDLRCDVLVCTHDHLDHLDTDAITEMKQESILFLAPPEAQSTLTRCGVKHFRPFPVGASFACGEFTLEAVYAHHTVPAIGVVVRHGGRSLYFSGDTFYSPELEALAEKKLDAAFICINGKLGNMNVEEAVRLTRILRPKLAIPCHYGMFDSNTEDPAKYTGPLDCALALNHGQEYDFEELMAHV